MKKLVSAILLTVTFLSSVLFSNPSSGALDITKYAWPPNYTAENYKQQSLLGYFFVLVDDFTQNNTGESYSFIRTTFGTQRLCKDFNDPYCIQDIEKGADWWTNQLLPPCENSTDLINCVEAVNLIDQNGKIENLKFEKLIPGNQWSVDPTKRVEAGSSSSRWTKINSANPNEGFKVTVGGNLGIYASPRSNVKSTQLVSMQASIEPYVITKGPYSFNKVFEFQDGVRGLGGEIPNYCLWVDDGECGVQSEFPENTRVEIVLHLATDISGWLLGRLKKPEFNSQLLGTSKVTGQPLSRVTISALPVEVPLFSTKVEQAAATPEIVKDLQENQFCSSNPLQCKGYYGVNNASSYFEYTYKRFQLFEKYFDNRASQVFPRWSVRSMLGSEGKYQECLMAYPGRINGIVTTNSAIYQGTPPTFDGETFNYKVASLHLLPNNEIFKGSYDLVLRSGFARCLYGFSNAPINANIEITNSDRSTNVATSTFTEKNGWVNLSINGFTFSQPTIKAKFSQESNLSVPTPTTAPKNSALKSTITCINGKTTKKVTAVVPKCPTGYKKK